MGGESEGEVGTTSEVTSEYPVMTPEPGLKYLEFLRVAVIGGTTYAVKLYKLGKENSGSLKASVDTVEGTVRTVAAPIAKKIESKLPELLQLADKRVEDTVQYLDILLPQTVKEKSFQAFDVARDAARQAPDTARTVVGQVQEQGVYNTASSYCTKFQPIAEAYGKQAWKTLLTLPLAPQAVGTARLGAEKLNQILLSLRDSQLPLSEYVPLLPMDYFEGSKATKEQFPVK